LLPQCNVNNVEVPYAGSQEDSEEAAEADRQELGRTVRCGLRLCRVPAATGRFLRGVRQHPRPRARTVGRTLRQGHARRVLRSLRERDPQPARRGRGRVVVVLFCVCCSKFTTSRNLMSEKRETLKEIDKAAIRRAWPNTFLAAMAAVNALSLRYELEDRYKISSYGIRLGRLVEACKDLGADEFIRRIEDDIMNAAEWKEE